MKKITLTAFTILLFLASNIAICENVLAENTSINGIITSDTIWTRANSPINITGSTVIVKGVTLTIEPGVVVHFNTNTLSVNGTLRAIGTKDEPITLNGDYHGRSQDFGSSDYNGILGFGNECDGWNPQTGTGCIIENANVVSLTISIGNASVKLNSNIFSGNHAWGGINVGGDSIISNNKITGGSVIIGGGSPVLINNTLIGQYISVTGGSPSIIDNLLYSDRSEIRITDNGEVGGVKVVNNIIANGIGFSTSGGNVTFEHNLVLYCYHGCSLNSQATGAITIQNNTIAFNEFGIEAPPASAKIIFNNLENNRQHNLVWGLPTNFDATFNWWGTTDVQAINHTISDYKTYFQAGNVTFIPYLEAPNPQAPLIASFVAPELPSTSPSTNTSPSASIEPSTLPTETAYPTVTAPQNFTAEPVLDQNLLLVIITILLAVVIGLLVVVVFLFVKGKINPSGIDWLCLPVPACQANPQSRSNTFSRLSRLP